MASVGNVMDMEIERLSGMKGIADRPCGTTICVINLHYHEEISYSSYLFLVQHEF